MKTLTPETMTTIRGGLECNVVYHIGPHTHIHCKELPWTDSTLGIYLNSDENKIKFYWVQWPN